MDIHCINCLEPWDTESVRFAKRTVEPGWTFKGKKSYTILACPCCKANGRLDNPATGPLADMVRTVSDLSGDDMDGMAADLDDLKWVQRAIERSDISAPSLKTHVYNIDEGSWKVIPEANGFTPGDLVTLDMFKN